MRRRGWVTRERFLDLLSAANLVPGPNATELAIHLGYVRAGFPGLLVAGAAFVIPAAFIHDRSTERIARSAPSRSRSRWSTFAQTTASKERGAIPRE